MEKLSDISTQHLPEGTITFLFTDIEGSTKLLHLLGDKYISLLDDHHRILQEIFVKWNGRVVDTEGDAFFVSFLRATEAMAAVVEAQLALADNHWPEGVMVRVRMGLHTGEPWTRTGGYVGMDVHRAARIAHVGYGGQVLLSETTAALLRGNLPAGVTLLDLGRHRLKDMQFPEHIRQLVISGLPVDFPPLKSLSVVEPADGSDPEPSPLPAFLKDRQAEPARAMFVGRERELAWMDERLDLSLQNKGGIAFVTGEAGVGKSSLLRAFADRATENVPDLLVTWGSGNAFIGHGDAYLPFRQAFGLLSGDVEHAWHSGTINTDQARRLWEAIPLLGKVVTQKGQTLATTLVDGRELLSVARGMIDPTDVWYQRLERLVKWAESKPADLLRDQLHQHCSNVLQGLSVEQPILLFLDDLQWADGASLNLLFHLGRSLTDSRVLIIGAFRPEEVALGRDGERHPLEKVVTELRRLGGDVVLDLENTSADDDRDFVNSLLDSEPNTLDQQFRQALLARTGGHALYTVEILRYMQEEGVLVKNQNGIWTAATDIGWDAFPHRVEGVIEERIDRLDDDLREVLNVASVEGVNFTAQIIGRVQGLDDRKLLKSLSRDLAKRHQLVRERSGIRIGRKLLSRYCFSHVLFQQYLYNDLSYGERQLLHADIAEILEDFYSGRTNEVAIQLARHFVESGEAKKALPYLLQAGDQARSLYAHQEAIKIYQQAISLFSQAEEYQQLAIEIYDHLGDVLRTIGRYEEAQASIEAAVVLTTDPWTLSRLYRFMAGTLSIRRDNKQAHLAIDKAEAALQRASQTPPEIWWREWLNNQFMRMNCYYWLNQIEDMVRLSEEMRPIVGTYGSPEQTNKFYGSLVNLGFRQERYVLSDEVVNYARIAYAGAKNTDDLAAIAGNAFQLGFSYLWHGWQGNLDKAEAYIQIALDMWEEIGNVLMRTRCLNYLAIIYRRRGERECVAELLPKVMAAAEKGNLQEYIAMVEANMAWLKWLEGDLDATKVHGKEALAIWQSLPTVMPLQWSALWPLIGAAITQNELTEAVAFAETLLSPELSRLPDDLVAILQQAISALTSNQAETIRACLTTALQQARQLNQL